MQVIAVNPDDPRPSRVATAVETLRGGGIVALPTETFYGLAVDAMQPAAIARLNELKNRPRNAPVLLLVDSAEMARGLAEQVPRVFDELVEMFWPGPLTLVVSAANQLPQEVTAGLGTVALRVPSLGLPRKIVTALGRPITGTSANAHGAAPCRTAGQVQSSLGDSIDILLDGGSTQGAAPSTILDLSGNRPRLLREGIIPLATLQAYLPDLTGPLV